MGAHPQGVGQAAADPQRHLRLQPAGRAAGRGGDKLPGSYVLACVKDVAVGGLCFRPLHHLDQLARLGEQPGLGQLLYCQQHQLAAMDQGGNGQACTGQGCCGIGGLRNDQRIPWALGPASCTMAAMASGQGR